MKYNKIIFLDIDGVLMLPPAYEKMNADCILRLRKIVEQTGAKIVVSSSWRTGKLEDTIESLKKGGLEDELILSSIVDETERAYHFTQRGSYLKLCRGNEIGTWVDRNLRYPWHANEEMKEQYTEYKEDGSFKKMRGNEVGKDYSYVILDDDTDMLFCQAKYFVNTDHIDGLTDVDCDNAISILNGIDKAVLTVTIT